MAVGPVPSRRLVGGRWQTAPMVDPLARFSPPTREWFASVFAAPTAVQAEAWRAIAAGEHALVVAPTGSGKTLAAFLWAIDSLGSGTVVGSGTRVVYVSPLKALGVDVERNLRAPLTGIVLVLEMTDNYQLILPMIITCLGATLLAQFLGGKPLYSTILARTLAKQEAEQALKQNT